MNHKVTVFIAFMLLFTNCYHSKGQLISDFPYNLSPLREVSLMVPGTLLLQASAIGHNRKTAMGEDLIVSLDRNMVNPIDRIATYWYNPKLNTWREYLEPASVAGTAVLIGSLGIWHQFYRFDWTPMMTLSLMYLEGAYLATGLMLTSKVIFNRPRPYTYNTDLSVDNRVRGSNNESFFSGNATILFYHAAFTSTILSDLFPESGWTRWVWASTIGLASLSGYWSVRSGMHFPTDVLMGALTGLTCGYLIPRMHKKKIQGLAVVPWISPYGKGISLNKIF